MADLKATKSVRQPDGSIVEMPAWYMKPKDMAILIDRLMVLFDRPSVISQHQGLSVTSELSAESLREFIEATRGKAGPSPIFYFFVVNCFSDEFILVNFYNFTIF